MPPHGEVTTATLSKRGAAEAAELEAAYVVVLIGCAMPACKWKHLLRCDLRSSKHRATGYSLDSDINSPNELENFGVNI